MKKPTGAKVQCCGKTTVGMKFVQWNQDQIVLFLSPFVESPLNAESLNLEKLQAKKIPIAASFAQKPELFN